MHSEDPVVVGLEVRAKALGFSAMGFARPQSPPYFDRFEERLNAGCFGDMSWLANHLHIRADPTRLLDGCRTVISLAYPYTSSRPCTTDGLFVARYTEPWQADYHTRVKRLAKELARAVVSFHPGCRIRVCVDSAPIMERSFAFLSGLGFIGKNNMLIIPGLGSYFFLAEILTDAPLTLPARALSHDLCGSCTRCVDACPTGALERPWWLDASRCLSYLTIEHKGMLDAQTGSRMGRTFFGCDACQAVCPLNDGRGDPMICLPASGDILEMTEGEFRPRYGKTALGRGGLEKIKANLLALAGS
jgi:epoxyqueuosine reductase